LKPGDASGAHQKISMMTACYMPSEAVLRSAG
jgi:hypothetical protein